MWKLSFTCDLCAIRSGTTIRTISADTNVRIYVPGKKDEAATNDIQVAKTCMSALSC